MKGNTKRLVKDGAITIRISSQDLQTLDSIASSQTRSRSDQIIHWIRNAPRIQSKSESSAPVASGSL